MRPGAYEAGVDFVTPSLYALGAIALWALLASLGILLAHVPPFLLTGVSLLVGSVWAWPSAMRQPRLWRLPASTLALGVFTLFGFHFFLFMGLRLAPAVEVNLVNYLWPLLIVVMAPLYLKTPLQPVHWVAAVVGFVGAAVAIVGASQTTGPATPAVATLASGRGPDIWIGYALALASAWIWANYSLQTQRLERLGRGFATASIGLFGLVAGILSLLCHGLLEVTPPLSVRDLLLLAVMGLGPLGGAFYLWDKALKAGDARRIGVLSYLTPLASTVLLIAVTQRQWTLHIVLAAALVIGAAVAGTWAE